MLSWKVVHQPHHSWLIFDSCLSFLFSYSDFPRPRPLMSSLMLEFLTMHLDKQPLPFYLFSVSHRTYKWEDNIIVVHHYASDGENSCRDCVRAFFIQWNRRSHRLFLLVQYTTTFTYHLKWYLYNYCTRWIWIRAFYEGMCPYICEDHKNT